MAFLLRICSFLCRSNHGSTRVRKSLSSIISSSHVPLSALGLCCVVGTGGHALAQAVSPWVDGMASRVRLVAGGEITNGWLIGVQVKLTDNWKTYWRHPGESGIGPLFDWSRSRNVSNVELFYPAPRRYGDSFGDIIGYEKDIIFPAKVTRMAQDGPSILNLRFDYAICKDICAPMRADLMLVLETGGADHSTQETQDMISRSMKHVPVPGNDPGHPRVERVTRLSDKLLMDIVHAADVIEPDLFVEGRSPSSWIVPLPREVSRKKAGSSLRLTYELDISDALSDSDLTDGLLDLTIVGGPVAVSREVAIPDFVPRSSLLR